MEFAWAYGLYLSGADPTVNLACGCGSLAILVLALKRGTKKCENSDMVCAGAALLAIGAGTLSRSPHVLLVGCMGAYVLGAIPAIGHAKGHPKDESLFAWSMWLAASTVYLLSQFGAWNPESIATAIVITPEEAFMLFIIYRYRGRILAPVIA